MKKHKLITDEQALDDFISWLPDLGKDEWYFVSILSRKKYDPEMIQTNDQNQIFRAPLKKEHIKMRLKEFEREVGSLFYKRYPITQKSIVCYINPNPRHMVKANKILLKKLIELIDASGFNVIKEARDAVQVAKSKSNFVHLEIDSKDIDLNLDAIVPKYYWIETRGGYHLLVDSKDVKGDKVWYKKVLDKYAGEIDRTGDMFLPIPGTVQGGFVPRVVRY
ncbi:MAG: hypothetical protein AAGA77_21710 [Bacteroidota bacterium]